LEGNFKRRYQALKNPGQLVVAGGFEPGNIVCFVVVLAVLSV
jgi:hypothetical protein